MGKKTVRFLAFDNGREDWREQEEKKLWETFSTEVIAARRDKPSALADIDTKIITKIQERLTDWITTGSFGWDSEYSSLYKKKRDINQKPEVQDYRRKMHNVKAGRQQAWIDHLMDEAINFFEKGLEKYNNYGEDDIFVLMLPEFFWTDIVDNIELYNIAGQYKEISGYVSPLYDNSYEKLISTAEENKLVQWMKNQNRNIIFFAGTAVHKAIDQDPMEEKIYNTLLIFSSIQVKPGDREVQISTWNKVNYSPIDGFSINGCVVREKIPYEAWEEVIGKGKNALTIPVINYADLAFSFDICLDYDAKDDSSVSKEKLGAQRADFNILIAGGMPIMSGDISNKSAIHTVRCDKVCFAETCCSVRIDGRYDVMKDIGDARIRYADFEVAIEGNTKTITMLK